MTKYMHTLNGKPAFFTSNFGGYISYVGSRRKAVLADNLRQIKREQRIATLNPDNIMHCHKYSYILVKE